MRYKTLSKVILKNDCHINVEMSTGACTVKVMICHIFESLKEIYSFKHERYVRTHEAFWNMLGFTRDDQKPSVEPLDLHFENMQNVMYENIKEVEEKRLEFLKQTILTSFFEMNASEEEQKHEPASRDVLHFIIYWWVAKERKWKRRKNNANFRDA